MSEYLFTYFTGEEEKGGEQIRFAKSRDGLFWEDVNGGTPVLTSNVGTGGARDPFPVRDPKTGIYYIIATDLKIEDLKDWQAAKRYGSRDLLVWESADLIHWSEVRSVTVGIEESGCVWAPEAVYDPEKEAFFVFFASWIGDKKRGVGKQKIYACYTKDFCSFTNPFLYIEREDDVIDTTLVKAEDSYFRISKNETTKKLILEQGTSLTGPFTEIPSKTLDALSEIEGPECYQLPDQTWCLIADRYSQGTGYLPMVTTDLRTGEFTILDPSRYNLGKTRKRHGGILKID